jgi:hypothetical protein
MDDILRDSEYYIQHWTNFILAEVQFDQATMAKDHRAAEQAARTYHHNADLLQEFTRHDPRPTA